MRGDALSAFSPRSRNDAFGRSDLHGFQSFFQRKANDGSSQSTKCYPCHRFHDICHIRRGRSIDLVGIFFVGFRHGDFRCSPEELSLMDLKTFVCGSNFRSLMKVFAKFYHTQCALKARRLGNFAGLNFEKFISPKEGVGFTTTVLLCLLILSSRVDYPPYSSCCIVRIEIWRRRKNDAKKWRCSGRARELEQ